MSVEIFLDLWSRKMKVNPRNDDEDFDTSLAKLLEFIRTAQRLDTEAAHQQFERSKSYITLVVSLGYAGLLAIWSYCQDIVPPRVHSLTGVLAGLSITGFVLFEIIKMYAMQAAVLRHYNQLGVEPAAQDLEGLTRFIQDREKRTAELQSENLKIAKRLIGIWPYFFYPTVFFGFGALLLLMYNLMAHLTGVLPFLPG